MNIIITIEQLGYINQVDFKVDWDDDVHDFVVTEWNHSDTQPDQAALDAAWADWLVANPGPSLDDRKGDANKIIDITAEQARLRYVTAGSAQAMTYKEKADDAAAFIAAGYPPSDLASYPFIQAEVNATGKTNNQAADDIIAKRDLWITIGAQIEEKRVGGKVNVDAATNEAEVDTARDQAVSDLDAI